MDHLIQLQLPLQLSDHGWTSRHQDVGRSISITQESKESKESQEENQSDGSRHLGHDFSKARARADALSSLILVVPYYPSFDFILVLFGVAKMLEHTFGMPGFSIYNHIQSNTITYILTYILTYIDSYIDTYIDTQIHRYHRYIDTLDT